ncbi:MAG: HAMP domain-containing histidine kinase [Lachnospiraceae bacterium]|nr:HAMP domain-containing histidine kinase [Lachnospiraceae bacterium]
MENQKKTEDEQEIRSRRKRRKTGRGMGPVYVLLHILLAGAAVLIVTVISSSYITVDTRKGPTAYSLIGQEKSSSFEDSSVFNSLFGNCVSDIICYGTIRGQMEKDGEFYPKKEVDVTAFANRYNGILPEYITADYYLEDLIKWAQAGFTYEEAYLSGEEADRFLSRNKTVTKVDLSDYRGGTVSYLNSDIAKSTKVVNVSGNSLGPEGTDRDPAEATIMNARYFTVEGKSIEDYVSTWEEYYDLCSNVRKAAEDLNTNYNEYLGYRDYYDSGQSNIVYFVRRMVGDEEQIFTNMETAGADSMELKKKLMDQCGKYLYYSAKDMEYETNTQIEEATVRYVLNGYDYSYPEDTQILIGVRSEYLAGDCFYQAAEGFDGYAPYVWQYLLGAFVCLAVYVFLLVVLSAGEGVSGRRDEERVIKLRPRDRIPTEIMVLAACAVGTGLYVGTSAAVNLFWRTMPRSTLIILAGAGAFLFSLLFSYFYFSFVRRIKAKSLWRGSLLRKAGKGIKDFAAYAYGHSNIILRVFVPFFLFVLLNLGGALLLGSLLKESAIKTAAFVLCLLILLAADGAVGYGLYRSAIARQLILEGIALINEGNLTHKVNESGMHGDELILARAVNSIGESVRTAVETSMKDERLKADLITNVSHDIKTPLTSIINYVDLIRRENVQDARVREYIDVLDAKSQRLKQLTDDLVEASKISSGNIVLQWEKINLVELLNQTIGEFSEKFEEKALYLVFNAPKGVVYIEADSRRIWRVIENLFNNIFKYALSGTRVYVDLGFLENEDGFKQVMLSVKNISAQPLKVNPEELTERFIRGDESRTTEGSGLGLSIAKNLTQAMKGEFEIVMDGDLFKVNLIFPMLNES